jgi:hypothetical protein
VALLFNPVVLIYLSREAWEPIDILTAVLFAIGAFTLPLPPHWVTGRT